MESETAALVPDDFREGIPAERVEAADLAAEVMAAAAVVRLMVVGQGLVEVPDLQTLKDPGLKATRRLRNKRNDASDSETGSKGRRRKQIAK